jgi:hypothetical protein
MTDNERLRKWLDAAVEGAYCAGAEQERAAVVAWLRGLRAIGQGRELYLVLRWAEAIERGEHRREEGA